VITEKVQEKRKENQTMEDDTYRFGEFSMSPRERQLFRNGETVLLPPKAFDAMYLLIRSHGNLVSRAEVFSTLWPGVHVEEANLTNIIVQLRKVLGRDAIQTVSKYGYRFTVPVTGEPGIKQAAYASFVRGKELLSERSLDSIKAARDLFWFCIANDPQFAAAWAWLGRTSRLIDKFNGEASVPDIAEAAFQRAFAIDPDLACAHHFYTHLQVDSGRAREAMVRLAGRLARRGEDPETLAGLVQALRCCGLFEDSVAAHGRATALDPTVKTSVAHTHFLMGDFSRVFETYNSGAGYYLDAAAWAGLGAVDRAIDLLRARLSRFQPGPSMSSLMASLLAVLENRAEDALAIMESENIIREPEGLFYLARHCGMLHAQGPALHLVQRARLAGFCSSRSLERDPAFAGLRNSPEFEDELQSARRLEQQACQMFHEARGQSFER
jgi:DNA-binding winged helix-turn-helix (wHTH) protein